MGKQITNTNPTHKSYTRLTIQWIHKKCSSYFKSFMQIFKRKHLTQQRGKICQEDSIVRKQVNTKPELCITKEKLKTIIIQKIQKNHHKRQARFYSQDIEEEEKNENNLSKILNCKKQKFIRKSKSIKHQNFKRYITSKKPQPRSEEYTCPICIEFMIDPALTPCGHSFCLKCLDEVITFGNQCPVCRTHIKGIQIFRCEMLGKILESKSRQYIEKKQSLKLYEGRMAELSKWRKNRILDPSTLKIGDFLDVRDTEHIWCKAQVKQIYQKKINPRYYDQMINENREEAQNQQYKQKQQQNQKQQQKLKYSILVHYLKWSKIYDEIIELPNSRICATNIYTSRQDIPRYYLAEEDENMRGSVVTGTLPQIRQPELNQNFIIFEQHNDLIRSIFASNGSSNISSNVSLAHSQVGNYANNQGSNHANSQASNNSSQINNSANNNFSYNMISIQRLLNRPPENIMPESNPNQQNNQNNNQNNHPHNNQNNHSNNNQNNGSSQSEQNRPIFLQQLPSNSMNSHNYLFPFDPSRLHQSNDSLHPYNFVNYLPSGDRSIPLLNVDEELANLGPQNDLLLQLDEVQNQPEDNDQAMILLAPQGEEEQQSESEVQIRYLIDDEVDGQHDQRRNRWLRIVNRVHSQEPNQGRQHPPALNLLQQHSQDNLVQQHSSEQGSQQPENLEQSLELIDQLHQVNISMSNDQQQQQSENYPEQDQKELYINQLQNESKQQSNESKQQSSSEEQEQRQSFSHFQIEERLDSDQIEVENSQDDEDQNQDFQIEEANNDEIDLSSDDIRSEDEGQQFLAQFFLNSTVPHPVLFNNQDQDSSQQNSNFEQDQNRQGDQNRFEDQNQSNQ